MSIYSKHFNTKQTAQSQPIPGKTMIPNDAGGYVFEISPGAQFARFLILGSEGGTYYVGESKLTIDNATNAIKYIQGNGLSAVQMIVEVSKSGRAPKNDAAIFALALATTFGDVDTKKAAYNAISEVCRTGTHLFMFLDNVQALRGWSRGLRNGVAKFYTNRSLNSLDLQLIKYRQRNGWSHLDALRLSHANGGDAHNARFAYVAGKENFVLADSKLLAAFEKLQATTNAKEAAEIILANNLPWEAVPTELLKSKEVYAALLENMPIGALVRQLGKLSSIGLIENNLSEATKKVVSKLTNVGAVTDSKIHPLGIYLALRTYSNGKGFRGSLTWQPAAKVIEALNDAFEAAFLNVEATGKDIVVGVDVSGSMSATINNTDISASEAAAVMAYVTNRVEPNVQTVLFDTTIKTTPFTKRDSLESIKQKVMQHGGGTDCAQPIIFANKTNINPDAVIIYTDNETWAGNKHAEQALADLRRRTQKPVKIINAATTATNGSINDLKDPDALGIAGFDAATPQIIAEFIKGIL